MLSHSLPTPWRLLHLLLVLSFALPSGLTVPIVTAASPTPATPLSAPPPARAALPRSGLMPVSRVALNWPTPRTVERGIEAADTVPAPRAAPAQVANGVVYLVTSKEVARSRDFYNTSPTWTNIKGTIPNPVPGAWQGIMEFTPDPFNPINRAWIALGDQNSLTTTGIYRADNLNAISPTWQHVLTGSQIATGTGITATYTFRLRRVQASPVQPGLVFILGNVYSGTYQRTFVGRSQDYGTNWKFSIITPSVGTNIYAGAAGLALSNQDANKLWVGTRPHLYQSLDMGKTFTSVRNFTDAVVDVHVPSHNNANETKMYVATQAEGSNTTKLWRYDGITWTVGSTNSVIYLNNAIGSYPRDGQRVFFSGDNDGLPWSFWYSTNGIAFTQRFTTSTVAYTGAWGVPADPNRFMVAAKSGVSGTAIALYSADGGYTWQNKKGNWWTAMAGAYSGAPGNSGSSASVTILDVAAMARIAPFLVYSGPGVENQKAAAAALVADARAHDISVCSCAQAAAGDPINTQTGGFDFTTVDLSLPTSAGQLTFQRTYASPTRNVYTTTLGYGWTHNHDSHLIFPADSDGEPGAVRVKLTNANQYRFTNNGNGTYTSDFGILATLTGTITTGFTLTLPSQSVFAFNGSGQVTRWADAQGHAWVYTYTSGLLTAIGAEAGRGLTFTYDGTRLASVSDHTGRSVGFGYDTNGDLVTTTDVLNQDWTYAYSGTMHLLTLSHDPRGITTTHTVYDSLGRATQQYDAQGRLLVNLVYNGGGSVNVGNANGVTETHTYNVQNTVSDLTDPLSNTITKTYDLNYRPTSVADPLSHTTQMNWSAEGTNLTRTVDALQGQTDLSYDSNNNLTELVDARRFSTRYGYSGTLLISITNAFTQTSWFTYTTSAEAPQPAGLLKAQSDPEGRIAYYEYDQFGQRVALTDTAGVVTHWAYDGLGRVVSVTAAFGTTRTQTTLTAYDAAGRVVSTTQNYLAGQAQNYWVGEGYYNLVTQQAYDAVGNITFVTDTLGRVTRNDYDANNRLITTTQNYLAGYTQNYQNSYNLVTVYGYNSLGLQVLITDTLMRVTRTEYDAADRPLTVTTNYSPSASSLDYNLKTVTGYDAVGNMVTRTLFAGTALARMTVTRYDALNRPVTVTANYVDGVFSAAIPDEDIITLSRYDANGNVTETVDVLGHVTRTDYDALNQPTTVTVNYKDGAFNSAYPDEDIQSVTHYNAAGQVDYQIAYANVSSLARTTHTQYDVAGRPVTVTTNYEDGVFDPNVPDRDLIQVTTYGPTGQRVATSVLQGGPSLGAPVWVTTTYDYDAQGHLITTTLPLTQGVMAITTNGYDVFGQVVSRTDALGQLTHADYDVAGRTQTITTNYGDGTFDVSAPDADVATATTYDALGQVTCTTEFANTPTPRQTCLVLDALGRAVTVTANYTGSGAFDASRPDENVATVTTYDTAGNRTSVTDPRGNTTFYRYDKLGRVVSITAPLSGTAAATTLYQYDALGHQVLVTDALGMVTQTDYDGLGRPTTVTVNYVVGGPNDATTNLRTITTYDAAGNRTRVTGPNGVVTAFDYDLLGRLITVTENYLAGYSPTVEINVSTGYIYNSAGNRLQTVDANNHLTDFRYDLAGRLVEEMNALGYTTVYTYNVVGDRTALRDANGQETLFTYDAGHRLRQTDYTGVTADEFFTYTVRGERAAMTDSSGTTTWNYDGLGRPLTTTLPYTNSLGYRYDANGNRTQLLYPNGAVVAYTFDAADRLVQVSDNLTAIIYQYDALGQTLTTTRPNTITSLFAYDAAHRLVNLTHQGVTQTVGAYTYTLNALGYRTSVTESLEAVTTVISYTYDPLARLTNAQYSSAQVFTYTHDAVGNRLSEQTLLATNVYTYDAANRLTNVNTTTYTWDDNGNLLNDGQTTYTYDAANRLAAAAVGGGFSGVDYSYAYNGLGVRWRQGQKARLWLGTPAYTTYTLDLNVGLIQVLADSTYTYTYGLGRLAQQTPLTTTYFLPDALGSVRQLADTTGAVVFTRSYAPYGNVLTSTGLGASSYGFTGEWTDNTGLVYLRARYYAPGQGRFLAQDPARQGMNWYLYANANPINYTDPTGLVDCNAECQSIMQALKPYILSSAQKFNIPTFTNMTTNGFAAFLAAKILFENRLVYFPRDTRDVVELGVDIFSMLEPFEVNVAQRIIDANRPPEIAGASYEFTGVYLNQANNAHQWYAELGKHTDNFESLNYTPYNTRFNDGLFVSLNKVVLNTEAEALVIAHAGFLNYTGASGTNLATVAWGCNTGRPTEQISAFSIAMVVLGGNSQVDPRNWNFGSDVIDRSRNWVSLIPASADVLGLWIAGDVDYQPYAASDLEQLLQLSFP